MKKLTRLLILSLTLLALGFSSISIMAQGGTNGALRFTHAVPGVTAVDVYINGELTVASLEYGSASGYINTPTGETQIAVSPAGLSTTLWSQSINVNDTPQTLIAADPTAPQFVAFEDDFTALPLGTTRLKVIHAIADAPAVNVLANEQNLVSNLAFGEFIGGFDIPADTYTVSVVTAADEAPVIADTPLGLVTGTTQLVVAYGTATTPEVMVLSARTEADGDAGFVRVAHAIPGAPNVNVMTEGIMLVPNLAFGETTEHIAIPVGDYGVQIVAADSGDTLLEADLSVASGTASTVVAQNADSPEVTVYNDDISLVTPDTALVSVINTISGDSSVTVTLADGTIIAEEVAFGEISDVLSLEPTTQEVIITFSIDGQSATLEQDPVTLYGGVYYNAIAYDGTMFSPPLVIFAPTVLAQGVGSTPASDVAPVLELPDATPQTAVEEPVETPAPAATEAPPAPTNPPIAPPVAVTEEPLPTGRILLDPGANLQLREYPSSQARSLGLAPSGSSLAIQGREGDVAPLDNGTLTIPPPLQDPFGNPDFVYQDPVDLLDLSDDNADLDPTDTWVYITYSTPDGGAIDAWVLSQYLAITAPDGDDQLLRDLDPIPSNREGLARNTDVTPPSAVEDVITVRVTGVEAGRNLNIRRTPETIGEVLGGIPSGSVAEVVGIGESGEWAFVRYLPSEGGTYTGWVNLPFVSFEFNGEAITVDELNDLGVLDTASESDDVGSVSAGAPASSNSSSAATPNPVTDAYIATVQVNDDVNLNLRRDPEVVAEVIARIPSGTRLVIDGRTADAEWLLTSFEGVSGWISSSFVTVTFNGTRVTDLTEIIIADGFEDTGSDAEATEEPTAEPTTSDTANG